MSKSDFQHDLKEFSSSFYFLYSYFCNESSKLVIKKKNENLENICEYVKMSVNCDNFADKHLQYFVNPLNFIDTLENDKNWIDSLCVSRVIKNKKNKHQNSKEFMFPNITHRSIEYTDILMNLCNKKCEICKKQCGIYNVIYCGCCGNGFHGKCMKIEEIEENKSYNCSKCGKKLNNFYYYDE